MDKHDNSAKRETAKRELKRSNARANDSLAVKNQKLILFTNAKK